MGEAAPSSTLPKDTQRYKWKVLITIALGTLMCSMDFSMVNLAFPKLTQVFRSDIDTVVWVTLAYTLANTSLLLIVGKLGDLLGRKRLYIAGETIFTLGLLACAQSQTIGQLIFFRVLLGIGGSMIISCGPAFIAEAFPPQEFGMGLGVINAAISGGFIIGPVAGGFLLSWLDWSAIFYTRFPFGLLATVMSIILLKPDQRRSRQVRFDRPGMLMSVGGLACLVFGVNQISRLGWANPLVGLLIGAGVILLTFFVWHERRTPDPILDFALFRSGMFSFFSAGLFIYFLAVPIFVLILPFFMIEGIGIDPYQAGLLLAVTSVVSIVVGPISGMLADRFGEIGFAALGVAMTISAYELFRLLEASTSVFALIPILALLGTGASMYQTPNNSAILKTVPKGYIGTASAFIALLRGFGLALGMALIGTVYSAHKAEHLAAMSRQAHDSAQSHQLSVFYASQETMLVAVIIFGIALALTLAPKFLLKRARPSGRA